MFNKFSMYHRKIFSSVFSPGFLGLLVPSARKNAIAKLQLITEMSSSGSGCISSFVNEWNHVDVYRVYASPCTPQSASEHTLQSTPSPSTSVRSSSDTTMRCTTPRSRERTLSASSAKHHLSKSASANISTQT